MRRKVTSFGLELSGTGLTQDECFEECTRELDRDIETERRWIENLNVVDVRCKHFGRACEQEAVEGMREIKACISIFSVSTGVA